MVKHVKAPSVMYDTDSHAPNADKREGLEKQGRDGGRRGTPSEESPSHTEVLGLSQLVPIKAGLVKAGSVTSSWGAFHRADRDSTASPGVTVWSHSPTPSTPQKPIHQSQLAEIHGAARNRQTHSWAPQHVVSPLHPYLT